MTLSLSEGSLGASYMQDASLLCLGMRAIVLGATLCRLYSPPVFLRFIDGELAAASYWMYLLALQLLMRSVGVASRLPLYEQGCILLPHLAGLGYGKMLPFACSSSGALPSWVRRKGKWALRAGVWACGSYEDASECFLRPPYSLGH